VRDEYDLVIHNGTIYDGSGEEPVAGSVAIQGQTIARGGPGPAVRGRREIDAAGLAVAPGFINMLSWAGEPLIADGRSQSDIRQGVTLEVMGEGWSMGPLTPAMKAELRERQGDIRYDITWTTLDEYLEHLVTRGVSCNVASFVGATTARIHVLGYEDRPPTPGELTRMQALVRRAMADGAVGVAASLIYAPACFASTDELIALARAAAADRGMYIAHLRSEGDRLLEAVEEHLTIAQASEASAEIYHLKATGRANWPKLAVVITRIEAARAAGMPITADMYPYPAGSTGLDASMPPWVQEGGHAAWVARLRDPAIRARVRQEIAAPGDTWENNYSLAGSPENLLFVGFKNPALKPLTGRTLAEVAALRGTSPEDTIIDLVIEDDSRVGTIYFTMDEANVRRQIALPWVSFGSDAGSLAPEGVFLESGTHPRAYGTFARLLGHYVREEGIIPLAEAIRRLTALPAANLKLDRRGRLAPGYFADVVVFDPARIADHATFTQPHQYATGMVHVLVNGTPVLRDGAHTGATPGRVVRGPGRRERSSGG
jgi:N-acyl-D-amino-acid deacylase